MAEHQVAQQSQALATAQEVADHLRLQVSTLANWRSNGTGPAYINLGGRAGIRYRWTDVNTWIADHTTATTAA